MPSGPGPSGTGLSGTGGGAPERAAFRWPDGAGERIAARFGRFYAPAALALLGLSFCPMFHDVVEHDEARTSTTTYGTLWDMAGRPYGAPAVLGITLMFLLIGLLTAASLRARPGRILSVAIVVAAVPIALMLVARPGTGDPTPSLTPYASAGLALVVTVGALAIAHTVVLFVARTGTRPARPSFWSIPR